MLDAYPNTLIGRLPSNAPKRATLRGPGIYLYLIRIVPDPH
jgi:hypothetical protein